MHVVIRIAIRMTKTCGGVSPLGGMPIRGARLRLGHGCRHFRSQRAVRCVKRSIRRLADPANEKCSHLLTVRRDDLVPMSGRWGSDGDHQCHHGRWWPTVAPRLRSWEWSAQILIQCCCVIKLLVHHAIAGNVSDGLATSGKPNGSSVADEVELAAQRHGLPSSTPRGAEAQPCPATTGQ